MAVSSKKRLDLLFDRCHVMTVICLLFVCLFFKQPVYASVFENMVADRVEIETVISKTGVISVRQTLTGELTGSTTRLSFTLQQPEHGSLELIELAYAQSSDKDNNHFGQLTAIVPFTGEAQRRPHLTYQTMRDDNHLIVEATGDFKAKTVYRFILRYQLANAIMRSEADAWLDYSFAALPPHTSVRSYEMTMTLPALLAEDSFALIPIAPVPVTHKLIAPEQIALRAENLQTSRNVRIFLRLPANQFPSVAPNSLQDVDLIEAAARDESSVARFEHDRIRFAHLLIALLLITSALLFALVYILFDRESFGLRKRKTLSSLSILQIPPALIALLIRGQNPGALILSTLLDLVCRGELALSGRVFTWLHPERNDFTSFRRFETYLLQWLFAETNRKHRLSANSLRNHVRLLEQRDQFRLQQQEFLHLIYEEQVAEGLVDQQKRFYGRITHFSIATGYVAATLMIYRYFGVRLSFFLLLPALLFVITGIFSRYLTGYGFRVLAATKTLRRELQTPLVWLEKMLDRKVDADMVRISDLQRAIYRRTRNELTPNEEAADLILSVLPLATAQKQTGTIADALANLQIAAGHLPEAENWQQFKKDLESSQAMLASAFYLTLRDPDPLASLGLRPEPLKPKHIAGNEHTLKNS